MITWEDFEKIDIRVGTIVEANSFEKAKKPAYQLKIDFGPLGILMSSAQITNHYALSDLPNKQIIGVVNFPPKKIANFVSQCLVLGIYDESGHVILLKPDKVATNGDKIG
jgi:tRNA-binding protein